MIEKLKTGAWFLRRPSFWRHAVALTVRKALPDRDLRELRAEAREWARSHAVPVEDALASIGLSGTVEPFPEALLKEAEVLANQVPVAMGGPGDITLLFNATRLGGVTRAVETGVAYG